MRLALEAHGHALEIEAFDDHVGRRIREEGWYERRVLEHMRGRCHPGMLAVDVGAHIGNHTLWLAAVCGARVVAIEPRAASRELLEWNVRRNGLERRVSIVGRAMGRRRGTTQIYTPDPDNTGMTFVGPYPSGLPVELDTLDNLAPGEVGMLKIDVEGMEMDVLAGGRATLAAFAPLLYVESDRPLELVHQLGSLGYARTAWFRGARMFVFQGRGR